MTIYGQEYINYTIDDGLTSNEVYHVFQDSKGFIWFATDNGVCRFDGKEFKKIDISDGLPDNTVFEIYEDYKGRIWFISFSSKLAYIRNDSIYIYPFSNNLYNYISSRPFPVKKSFKIDSLDNVYLSIYKEGIFKISNTGNISKYGANVLNDSLNVIYFTNDDMRFAASTSSSMQNYIIGYSNGEDYQHLFSADDKDVLYGHMFNLYSNRIGRIFTKGNILFFPDLDSLFYKDLNSEVIWADTYCDEFLTLGFRGGGACITKDNKLNFNKRRLKGFSVTSILFDKAGGIWFSTLESGVFYERNTNWENVIHTNSKSIVDFNNMAIDNKNNIWLGGNFGFLAEYINGTNIENEYKFGSAESINDIFLDSYQNVWVITNKDLYKKKQMSKVFQSLQKETHSTNYFAGNKIVKGNDSCLWIVGTKSLMQLNNNDQVIFNSKNIINSEIRIDGFYEDENGEILIGTLKGLSVIKDSILIPLYEEEKLLKSRIIDIIKIGNNYLLGTKGNGLIILAKDSVIQYSTLDGLSSNSITSICYDGINVWVGTNFGLNLVHIENNKVIKVKNIYVYHGLVSENVKKVVDVDGDIYVATNKGVTVFPKGEVVIDKYQVPIFINGIEKKGMPLKLTDSIIVPFTENRIKLSFNGLSYSYNSLLKYKYRLSGLNESWQTSVKDYIIYPYIPHGDYVFEVYAINPDGYESKLPAKLFIRVLPPIWRELWFRFVIASIVAFVLIFIFISIKNTVVLSRKKKKKYSKLDSSYRDEIVSQLDLFKEKLLYQQISPHFIFNALNSIRNFILHNDKNKSNLFIEQFSKLMRKVVEFTNIPFLEIEEEIIFLTHYLKLEAIRFDNKFKYQIDIMTPGIEHYRVPPMIIQPFVENAVWHAFDDDLVLGSLLIQFIKEENQIVCLVKDNGDKYESKIDKRRKTKSFGVSVTKKRINLINAMYGTGINVCFGDELISRNLEYGTLIEIRMPILNPII